MAKDINGLQPISYYHIYNRGNNKENIFKEDKNYNYFMSLLEKYILPVASLHAYCLMPNHFHLLIQTKELPERKDGKYFTQPFSNFFNAYAKTINKAYNRTGSLFQERFGRKEIDSSSYYTTIVYYIHGNPQHHNLVKDFRKYTYSSYHNFINNTYSKLSKAEVLDWFGGMQAYIKYHELYHIESLERKFILEGIDDDS
jgi:putative transposase